MGLMIVFTCPHTGHDVSSGVPVDEATVSRLPGHKMRMACKECGREHEWWVAEGRLGRVEDVHWPVPARIA
jgi:transcription elongation factor Elf1